jgi:23S rRNA (uracil1939-C5)-methyltransferase
LLAPYQRTLQSNPYICAVLKKNQILDIKIDRFAFGGNGIGLLKTDKGDFTVFVENTYPGQFVRAQVIKTDKRFANCKLVEVLENSPDEIELPFQRIPGAPYAAWPIEKQHEAKKDSCLQLYKRIGKIENIDELFDEYIESPSVWNYRNKMEYSFSAIRYDLPTKTELDDFGLGFKHRGTWWMVENLDAESGLFDATFENNLHRIRTFCIDSGLPPWHPPKREGFFRYVVVRKSFTHDILLINLVTTSEGLEQFDRKGFVKLVLDILGERCGGIIHTLNDDTGDRAEPLNGSSHLLFGNSEIEEILLGLKFKVNMKSFFQTNPKSAERLYTKAIDYCNPEEVPDGYILDLFCGTGTIGQLIAKKTALHVVGVDIVEAAIEDAKKNAKENNVSNIEFFAADVGKFLLEQPQFQNQINTLVLDPPRGGIAPKTLRKVIGLDAKRIVYISCNPATQARDCETLILAGYNLKKISFVDQFPHTSHLEAVALFEKN